MPTSRLVRLILGLGISIGLYSLLPVSSSQAQQPANDVAIDNDDIGGVVNGPKGPEAGVWVIAETRDLPVRYIKTVVTDDRGRFVVPDLPQASYSVWARGYGLVDSAKTTSQAGTAADDHRDAGAERSGRRALLPGDLLVLDAEDPCRRSVRRQEQHPAASHADSVDQRDEEHRLHRLPSARPAVHAHDPGRARNLRLRRRRLASSRAVGPVGSADAGTAHRTGRYVVRQLRRLDRSHREGRAPVRQTAAAPGCRAQHRRHAARLDEREAVPPRPDCERPALPHRQRVRSARRLARVQLGRSSDPRSGQERGDDVQGAGERSRACR